MHPCGNPCRGNLQKGINPRQVSFIKNTRNSGSSDQELVMAYHKDGRLEVLGELYQRYLDLVYGVCLKYLGDSEPAKDAVMQIFEELVIKLRRHEVGNFRSWLHTLARNHCLMQLRSQKNKKIIPIPEELMQSGEELHLNGELQKEAEFRKLARCLETLSRDQQEAVELFYLKEKSYQDIARETGHDWNKVRSLIQNGRRNLKSCLEKKQDLDT
jgi:RNA polymerase sigma factor (sigma-70 family)